MSVGRKATKFIMIKKVISLFVLFSILACSGYAENIYAADNETDENIKLSLNVEEESVVLPGVEIISESEEPMIEQVEEPIFTVGPIETLIPEVTDIPTQQPESTSEPSEEQTPEPSGMPQADPTETPNDNESVLSTEEPTIKAPQDQAVSQAMSYGVSELTESDIEALVMYPQSEGVMYDRMLQPMITERAKFATVSMDGYIYVIGGINANGIVNTIEMYDYYNNSWTEVTTLPENLRGFSAAVIGNIIYISGGYANGKYLDKLYAYDTETDTWTQLKSMKEKRERHSLVSANGILYAIGGRNEAGVLSSVEKYNPIYDTWTKADNMNEARMDVCAVHQGNYIYVIGGFTDEEDGPYLETCTKYNISANSWGYMLNPSIQDDQFILHKAVVYGNEIHAYYKSGSLIWENIYNIEQNKWNGFECTFETISDFGVSVLEDGICLIGGGIFDSYTGDVQFRLYNYTAPQNISLNLGVAKFETAVVNGELYIVGGRNSTSVLSSIYKYNEDTGKWNIVTHMPEQRRGFTVSSHNDSIYIIGGYYNEEYLSSVVEYNTITKQWSVKTNVPYSAERLGSVVLNNKIYVAGGRKDAELKNDFFVYDIETDTWSKLENTPHSGIDFNIEILDNKIYIMGGFGEYEPLTYIDVYDISSGEWGTVSNTFPSLNYTETAAYNGKILISGQDFFDGSKNIIIKEYIPYSNKIIDSNVEVNFKNAWYGFEKVNSQLWLIGGYGGSYSSYIRTIYSEGINNTRTMATLNLSADSEYTLHFYAEGIESFNKTFVINYDPDKISVIDLCGFTPNYDLTKAGDKIQNTDIKVKSWDEINGKIELEFDRDIPSEYRWYGDLNIIKFKANTSGNTDVIFYISAY